MFKMILLHSILLFTVIKASCQELSTTPKVPDKPSLQQGLLAVNTDEIQDLRVQVLQQNTKIAQLDTKFAVQNAKISDQNAKISDQNAKISDQNAKISDQNAKFAVQNAKISDQNTKLAEQDIQILEQNTKIKDLEMEIEELEKDENQPPLTNNSTSKGTGGIFTRWGRRDCPIGISQLVYSGITGGSYYTHAGGAAEYVCLPPDPTWNVNKHFNGPYWGYMYGTEYEDVPGSFKNYKVPCAVCRTSQFSTVLMIPARAECYQGWQKAYNGNLVSGYHNYAAASQYVCLDDNPHTKGTNHNNEGKLMYTVRARCGSLPCPPYEDNTLLACVVCLK